VAELAPDCRRRGTQVVGTLAAVYGWFVTPIGWRYALLVWAYAIVWLFVNDTIKVAVYRLVRRGHGAERRHLARIGARLQHGA
jgi:H+-transporting ATPase